MPDTKIALEFQGLGTLLTRALVGLLDEFILLLGDFPGIQTILDAIAATLQYIPL